MKFKLKRSSDSGKKIEKILIESRKCFKAQRELAKDLGFKSWRGGYWCCWGGISCAIFEEAPDSKLWMKEGDGYYPKRNSKAGKALAKRFENLPRVTPRQLNECVGFDENMTHIGLNQSNEIFFGITAKDDWVLNSSDLIEITNTDYKKLFKQKDS